MLASACPMTMGPFERAWKAAERFALAGTPQPTCFSGPCCWGFIPRYGTGWGGRDTPEVKYAKFDRANVFEGCFIRGGLRGYRGGLPPFHQGRANSPPPQARTPGPSPRPT